MRSMNENEIAFLGGDRRMAAAAKYVAAQGYTCVVWGLNEEWDVGSCRRTDCDGWKSALNVARAVVLPMPVSNDGVRLYCPGSTLTASPKIRTLFDAIETSIPVFGGRITETVAEYAEKSGLTLTDYSSSEEMQIRNAVPTAEAAVMLALQMMDVTIRDSRCAVIGFGRIGRYLAELLRDMGADVTVAARKCRDLSAAESMGLQGIRIFEDKEDYGLYRLAAGYDLIVNTVPVRLIGKDLVSRMTRRTHIIDLASFPGGVDMQAAEEAGLKAEWGLALPGRYFPESAGIIIGKTVTELLERI